MDREYLFRGKRLDNGEWIGGDLLTSARYPGRVWITERKTFFDGQLDGMLDGILLVAVDPTTVGPYIGLTDRRGVKIYKGDILISHYDEDHPEDVTIEVVTWAENGWCTKVPGGDICQLIEDGVLPYSTVIGNIYDDRELVEEDAP